MVGATSSSNGSVGYVNAVPPKDGYNTKYLRADGTWQVPPDHTYTVNNATLTIQKNGTTVKTFTANASSNVTCNITVPTKTSDLTNDSGFISSEIDSMGEGWVRFKCGLQICWVTDIATWSSCGTWTYPKTFISIPCILWQAWGADVNFFDVVGGNGRTTSYAEFIPFRNSADSFAPYGVSGLAIGRWK